MKTILLALLSVLSIHAHATGVANNVKISSLLPHPSYEGVLVYLPTTIVGATACRKIHNVFLIKFHRETTLSFLDQNFSLNLDGEVSGSDTSYYKTLSGYAYQAGPAYSRINGTLPQAILNQMEQAKVSLAGAAMAGGNRVNLQGTNTCGLNGVEILNAMFLTSSK